MSGYFLLPRMKRDNTSNVSLFENKAEELLYNSHNTSNFTNEEIQLLYNLYKPYLPDLVFWEHIYNSPPHKDIYMPTLYEYSSGKYTIQVPHRIAGTPAYYPESYCTTYTTLINANKYIENLSDIGYSEAPSAINYNIDGYIFNTKILIDSNKNKALLRLMNGYESNLTRAIKIYLIDSKIFIVLQNLIVKSNILLGGETLSNRYYSSSQLPNNHNSLDIGIEFSKNSLSINIKTGIDGSSYQDFCSLNLILNTLDFYNFGALQGYSYATSLEYSEYTSTQGNQTITKYFDQNLNQFSSPVPYQTGFIAIGPQYQSPYKSSSTNVIGTTDPEFVGENYIEAPLVFKNTSFNLDIETESTETLSNLTPYSNNTEDIAFYLSYDKGTVDNVNLLDKIYIDDIELYLKLPPERVSSDLILAKSIQPSPVLTEENADLPCKVEIKEYKDSSSIDGSVYIDEWYGTSYFDGSIYVRGQSSLDGTVNIDGYNDQTELEGTMNVIPYDTNDMEGYINVIYKDEESLPGRIYTRAVTKHDLPGQLDIRTLDSEKDLNGYIYLKHGSYIEGTITVKSQDTTFFKMQVIVPDPEVDLEGTMIVQSNIYEEVNLYIIVPKPEIDLPGTVSVRKETHQDLFPINIRVPVNVGPEPYLPITGNYIVEIPWPYPQFTDMEFILTQVVYPQGQTPANFMIDLQMFATSPDNLFIPQRFYKRYDENHILLSDELGLKEGDEIRFTFCHNDGKFHIKKMEFYFKAKGNASYYYLDIDSPYKKRIDDTNIKFLVFVNRRQVVLNKDYTIDNELGRLTFINDDLAQSTDDRIDVVCFYTGIDDTAVADLPMSGYIYLKRNMIDRNYNNNLMATFINGRLIQRDKILHISNNIYKVKEDIKSRYDLQILNMSNRIDCMVPFYKQSSKLPFTPTLLENGRIIDNYHPKYMEWAFPISITVPELVKYGRQHMTMYHNPVYFSPQFLLENKKNYIALMHLPSPNWLNYTLNFYANDTDPAPSEMQVKLELHIKTPFEETKEESRSSILLCNLPATITQINEEYCYCALQIKQIINLDVWNNRFLEMCDGIIIRMEPGKTYENEPSEVYFDMHTNTFEDYEKEQITVFEYRISDKYDGLGNISYRKEIAFNPEEENKTDIRNAESVRTD